ncbi:hypothetical protein LR48_Vigan01g131400 [Vigna angularis]|uniref:Uncharacterized protein n=1 Tax=Phaseolus angularis TaxID=3914 RepID=A0A0L9TNL2_PHAAN|nr:hypothetical protein LR48_Vigan01g131400 [Vigna angularis]
MEGNSVATDCKFRSGGSDGDGHEGGFCTTASEHSFYVGFIAKLSSIDLKFNAKGSPKLQWITITLRTAIL